MTPVCPFTKASRPVDASGKRPGEDQNRQQSINDNKGQQDAVVSPKCPFGYDSQTFKLGPLSCMICQALLFQCSKCMPCSHVYCKACVSWFKDCPLCGADIEKIEDDLNLQSVVDRFIEGHTRIKRFQIDTEKEKREGDKKTVIYEDVSLERGAFLMQQAMRVAAMSKQFALLHNALKFEALHLLSTILSSNYSEALNAVLRLMKCNDWATCVRVGIMDVLQSRVAPADKLQALVLAECVISIVGEEWLIGPITLPDARNSFPADRCIMLILETSRVEIAVVLNELAYLKYEASKNFYQSAETFHVALRNLGVAFSLVERIIKLVAKFGENEESKSDFTFCESTSKKIIVGLNETIGVILDYLQDAKDHGERKGDDLLASVRIVGSYLAEAPCACKEKVKEVLGYMLSVEGEDEHSLFCSITFLLPLLCQITMSDDGCKIFASAGAFGAVVGCLYSLIHPSGSRTEHGSTIFLACDTILNFLLKREQVHFSSDNPSTIKLLQALSRWTEETNETSVIMMASSICSLILDSTSEEALLRHPDFNADNLIAVSQLMKRGLVTISQELMSDDSNLDADLHPIITSGYSSWANRFPHIKQVIER